jgi:hypothetical protein
MKPIRNAWVMGGSLDPEGRRVFGVSEHAVAFAAVESYYAALARSKGLPEGEARSRLADEFRDALHELVG